MSLSLRAKLILIVGATAASLAIVIALGVQLSLQQSQRLDDLEQRLVPKLELAPRLEAQFDRLGQDLKDAVAAQDRAALDATDRLLTGMFELIEQAGSALGPGEPAQLREGIADYHRLAMNVSSRLLDGETGEQLVDAMSAMQAKHQSTMALIERVARLDRRTLKSGFETLHESSKRANQSGLAIAAATLLLVIGLSAWFARQSLDALAEMAAGFTRFGKGDFDQPIVLASDDELGRLALEANRMASALQHLSARRDASDWISAGQVALSESLRGDLEPGEAARAAVAYLSRRLDAVAGALYLGDGDGALVLAGGYAAPDRTNGKSEPARRLTRGGLLSEVALDGQLRVLGDLPPDYLEICSGLGAAPPATLILLPLMHGERSVGVVELALFKPCSVAMREFLGLVSESLAVALESAKSRARLRDLLEESQTQAARLSSQEEELIANNQELSAQQEELRLANDELESQRSALRIRNTELEGVRISLQEKADELLKVSAYKTQFLANMSHELRTPLNSMLLLSQLLADNDAGNLTGRQVEHCRTIYSAGKGLLALINQVLDLSKIEAGKQELELEQVMLGELADQLQKTFEPQFTAKGLTLAVEIAPDAPESITIDGHRLQRILINLLGNALKFTETGGVTLRIRRPPEGTRFERLDLVAAASVAFSVCDTGVGIPLAAQSRVFSRFEQADARTARRYGGTGLGLAIARESAQLMGGELQLESVEGRGSTFTCVVPERASSAATHQKTDWLAREQGKPAPAVVDDRANLATDEPHLLIVEDDPVFAACLLDVVHGLRLKALVASNGQEGLQLARERTPVGIVLDVQLPDIDGFAVREQLRQDPQTGTIPVHFVSAVDAPQGPLGLGAVGYLTKPAPREALVDVIQNLIRPQSVNASRVLIVEDDPDQAESIVSVLRECQIEARQARSADEAVRALEGERFGCMVLDLGLPDVDGLRLLEDLQARADIYLPPVVVHTGRALSREETRRIRDYAESVVLKDGRSAERLVDEVRLFVGQLREKLPRHSWPPRAPEVPAVADIALMGTKILVADDDMRTVYALSALLRGKGAEVLVAETGREALRALAEHANVRIVLMDIMMPDMDGYEAMRSLRQDARYAALPVIALTAKAMKGERERCREAGANEYLAKPVDPNGLLVLLKTLLAAPLAV
jgi:CheY-like chemotaxis protein/signal transduction histidine kinase/HAMP domain-containing protein